MPSTHERKKPKTPKQKTTNPIPSQTIQQKTQTNPIPSQTTEQTQTIPIPRKRVLYKINVLGESGVGKTSFIKRYTMGTFQERYKTTIGIDFMIKTINNTETKTDIVLQIWDTAGRERFSSLGSAFLRGSDGLLLLYDITDKKSFDSVVSYYDDYKSQLGLDNPNVVLIGTKLDKKDTRKVSTRQGEELAKALGISFLETSAKDNFNVDKPIELLLDVIGKRVNEEDAVIDEVPLMEIENSKGWLSSFCSIT